MRHVELLGLGAATLALAAGVILIAWRRIAVASWATAWLALGAAGVMVASSEPGAFVGLSRAMMVLFVSLQLAGAYVYRGRSIPGWVLPTGLAVGLVGAVIATNGFPFANHLLVLPYELFCLGLGIAVLIRPPRWGLQLTLATGLLAVAITVSTDALLEFVGSGPPWLLWLGVGVPVSVGQLVATLDQLQRVAQSSAADHDDAKGELDEVRQRFEAITHSTRDGVVETDAEGRVVFVSDSFAGMLGESPENMLDELFGPRIHPDDLPMARERNAEMQTKGQAGFPSLRVRHRRDGWRAFDISAHTYTARNGEQRVLAIARDVNEQLRLETHARNAQKLESLGVLAGGIAHDFNNLLTGILGHADLAAADLEAGHPSRDSVDQVIAGARRAARLTRQLLAYAGDETLAVRAVDVGQAVASAVRMLRAGVSARVAFDVALEPDLPDVAFDVRQLGQTLVNVVLNAAEAYGDESGTVAIRAAVVDVPVPPPTATIGALRSERYVRVEIRDDGPGIDPTIAPRVFDPFFSTQFVGRGMGLAVVQTIVRAHRAALILSSEPGQGTRVALYLPLAAESAEPSPQPEPDLGWILVVDDEDTVRSVARGTLARRGFEVVEAPDGEAALAALDRAQRAPALVLLDASMPGLPGEAVVAAIHAREPALPVLLMSGHTEADARRAFSAGGLAGFVAKPFTTASLSAAVRAALEWNRTNAEDSR